MEKLYLKIDPSLAEAIKNKAKEVVYNFYEKNPYSGRTPSAIGSASVYISCKLNNVFITQTEIAKKGNKSVSVIRNAYLSIKDCLRLTV